jgi:hypothetical protein
LPSTDFADEAVTENADLESGSVGEATRLSA